ncbi:MAG: MFS transporter, partial [Bacteroidia bacterium]|nr:MFS transporter [Bacteroidia bacterium]
YAFAAYPCGWLADKVGIRSVFAVGLACFASSCLGMAFDSAHTLWFGVFAAYGLFMAATEGGAKAWLSAWADKNDAGAAVGLYDSLNSVALLTAGVAAGALWQWAGPNPVFVVVAAVAGGVAVVVWFLPSSKR